MTEQLKADFQKLIVWEDEDYVLINKPHSISSLDERLGKNGKSILKMAKEYCPDAQLCHRLDKETTGVMAIAKNPEAYRHLSMQFENREVKKVYHAVVNGSHNLDGIEVNLPISPAGDSAVRIDRENGKVALTYFNTIKAFKDATLAECMPLTGRMHQIRIHLSCLKAPIVADKQYGGKDLFLSNMKRNFKLKKDTHEHPIIKRVALHAYALAFKPLKQDEEVVAIAPYPKDFAVLVKLLEEHNTA